MQTAVVTTLAIAVLGPVAGVLWHAVSPTVTFVVVRGEAYFADGESQAPIGTDARFALIGIVAGLLCGLVAYRFGGRDNDVPLLVGLALGGTAAALLAWWVGHRFGLAHYQHVLRTGADGTEVKGPPDVRARGLLVFWPLAAVAAYAALEVIVKRLPADTSSAADSSSSAADSGAPADGDAPPPHGGTAPSGNGATPADGGTAPADSDTVPSDSDTAPSGNGAASPDPGAAPADGGAGSGGEGRAVGGGSDEDGPAGDGTKGVRRETSG
ncbi:hypothetical protein EBO15_23155 [Actinomadura harenae]|uniref:DUF2567 domain-containing protein n=1 Tax=Actinomadura harenae TaxID=2483351 RepID=A0A3M2LV35_9ACTN|nr:hypothetical protein EBO15_23155 [Actinomadura harenae]